MTNSRAIWLALGLVTFGAVAGDFFLANINMPESLDRETEYSSAKGFFSASQSVLNADGHYRAGDTFNVYYNDGAIIKFTLGTLGMVCTGTKCVWATSEPFDETKTTRKQGVIPFGGKQPISLPVTGGGLFPLVAMHPYPTIYDTTYTPTVTIIQGPPDSGGGVCNTCPKPITN